MSFFKNRQVNAGLNMEELSRFQKELSKNPYLQSKALWNDMYGDLEHRYRKNQLIIIILTAVIALAMIGLIIVAGEIKVKSVPFVIHGNELITITDEAKSDFQSIQPKMAIYFAKQFIHDARSVSVDADINIKHKIASFSLVTGAAMQILKDFYEKNDPNIAALHQTKDIEITSILPQSARTLSIRWKENTRDMHSGEIVKIENYIADISYQYTKPSDNETILKNNPLGFYITYFSWTLDQNVGEDHAS